jgi:outer membrane scaffolding protein for murein synthesis (MipA/OmpV family)
MKPLLVALSLLSLNLEAAAQAPVFEPMPDGSRDVFLGLGVASRARYEGASDRRTRAEPLIQASWSSGLFVSGLQAGWHMGDALAPAWPRVEWGPLLNLQTPRNENGRGWGAGSVGLTSEASLSPDGGPDGGPDQAGGSSGNTRLHGMDTLDARLEAGAFFNLRASARWRLTQSLLAGAGESHQGLRWGADLQYIWPAPAAHHSLSSSVGASWANAEFTRTYFGVTEAESERSGNPVYQPGSGLMEARASLRWNWLLHPSWVLSTAVELKYLQGPARRSPLVERAHDAGLSTTLVYRF